LELILFVANNVFPVFLIIGLGQILRRLHLIDANFCTIANQLIFIVALPAFVFAEMLKLDVRKAFDFNMVGYAYLGTFLSIFLAWGVGLWMRLDKADLGSFIQGSFRGNLAIIGLALIQNIGGAPAIGKASVILAFVLPLYNVLAIVILSIAGNRSSDNLFKNVLRDIAMNPLLGALAAGFVISLLGIRLPNVALTTVNYLASLSIPLALIGIGGSIGKENMQQGQKPAFYATFIKLLLSPVILTMAAYFLGFRNIDLLILYIVFGAPTAIISYVMADQMGGNGILAGSIIMLTTFFSVFSISAAVLILRAMHIL
jgi:predicted permease